MISINDIKKELNISYPAKDAEETLSDINGRLDMGMAGAIKEYLFPYDEYNTLSDKLDELIEEPQILKKHGFFHDFNIFPAKQKCAEIFPDFLCICRGETRLSSALSQIKKVSEGMVNTYGKGLSPLKNVLLITDKWNDKTFAEYEADFMYKAINYNVWFVILLVVGRNLCQIPFLPNDRMCFTDIEWAREKHFAEEFSSFERRIEYPRDGFMFEIVPGPWNQAEGYRYLFDPVSLTWHWENVIGECRNGEIHRRSFEKFIRNVKKLIDEKGPKLVPLNNSCDDSMCVLDMFGDPIKWAYSDTESNPELLKLQMIVDEFIQKCDSEYMKG